MKDWVALIGEPGEDGMWLSPDMHSNWEFADVVRAIQRDAIESAALAVEMEPSIIPQWQRRELMTSIRALAPEPQEKP